MAIATMSLCSTAFEYSPLTSKPRTFRLIQLLPSARSLFPLFGKIARIRIIEKSLDKDDTTPYDALSYTWGPIGDSKPSRPIIVETPEGHQRIFKIYPALEVALLSLAARKEQGLTSPVEDPLFVDQICINQNDKAERSSQVQLMGDIYARCARAVVWLGPATRRSDEMFAFAEEVCGGEGAVLGRVMGPNVGHFPKVYEAAVDPNYQFDGDGDGEAEAIREDRDGIVRLVRRYGPRFPLHGVADVFGRAWFNRLWVIQEVCLAPNVVYWINNLKPNVSKNEIRLRNDIFTLNATFVRFLQERKALHVNGKRMSLYELVLKYSVDGDGKIKVGAKLAQDRIYGLLGLARDEEIKRNTEVKYDDGLSKVYTRFAASVVQQDLDVILYSQKGKSETDLPSWVPDWSAAHLKIPCGYSDVRTPMFSAGGKTLNQLPVVDECQGSLMVQGYFVDRVSRTGMQGVQRDRENSTLENVDFVSAARFFDEITEFLESAGNLAEPRFPYASDHHLRGAAAIRLADGGLSSRQFSTQFEPAMAQTMLGKIHRHAHQHGHRIINTELTTQSYSITHIIRRVGIYAFVANMIGFVRDSLAVQLTAWKLHLRQRYFAKVDMGGGGHYNLLEQIGIDSLRPWEQYTSNLYKTIGRKLFLTDGGYLGLGPEDMKEGDVIVVLVGSSTPHVLRTPADDYSSSQSTTEAQIVSANSNPSWSYVGEAFCEGIMDGEILMERGVEEATDFRIL